MFVILRKDKYRGSIVLTSVFALALISAVAILSADYLSDFLSAVKTAEVTKKLVTETSTTNLQTAAKTSSSPAKTSQKIAPNQAGLSTQSEGEAPQYQGPEQYGYSYLRLKREGDKLILHDKVSIVEGSRFRTDNDSFQSLIAVSSDGSLLPLCDDADNSVNFGRDGYNSYSGYGLSCSGGDLGDKYIAPPFVAEMD